MSSACSPNSFRRLLALCLLFLTANLLALSSLNASFNTLSEAENCCKATTPRTNYRLRTVVIDAGHGGKDPGGMGANSQEKHIALSIAQKLRDKIVVNYPHINVIMTRSTDEFIPLYERAAIANRNKADLFISIHANIMPGSQATYGTETFVMGQHVADYNLKVAKRENATILLETDYEENYDYDPNSDEGHILMAMYQNAFLEQSILFAELVEQQFADHAGRKSRGVKQAGFVVLKATAMPSVLVETGFMSNLKEEAYLLSDDGQEKLAAAIFEAFSDYHQLVNETKVNIANTLSSATDRTIVSTNENTTTTSTTRKSVAVKTETKSAAAKATPAVSNSQPATVAINSTPATTSKTSVTAKVVADVLSKEVTTPVVTKPVVYKSAPTVLESAPTIVYAVQVAATTKPLDLTQLPWANINMPLVKVKEDAYLKYQVRGIDSAKEALRIEQYLEQIGFEGAFIVAYRNNVKLGAKELNALLFN